MIRLNEVYKTLNEVDCPRCNDPNAYVGMNDVECPNPDCTSYNPGVPAGLGGEGQGGSDVFSDYDIDTMNEWVHTCGNAGYSQDDLERAQDGWNDVKEIFDRNDIMTPPELEDLRIALDHLPQDLSKEIEAAQKQIDAM